MEVFCDWKNTWIGNTYFDLLLTFDRHKTGKNYTIGNMMVVKEAGQNLEGTWKEWTSMLFKYLW